MNLFFDKKLVERYKSPSQIARVLTESWVKEEIYCPNCGEKVSKYPNNKPAADFYCEKCSEDFELKSKNGKITRKVVDGEYRTMIERLNSLTNPNFFVLSYNRSILKTENFFIIPKHFFTDDLIEKRNPLSVTAQRRDWVGCNILLREIPLSGRVYYVRDGEVQEPKNVTAEWNKTLFLRDMKTSALKGWTLEIMKCIDNIKTKEFLLSDMYKFEDYLSKKHPQNKYIKDKIRQQLQILRDKNYLEFVGRGMYRKKV
jgi:type II restriction enzyme